MEEDWLRAMDSQLEMVREQQKIWDCPVFIAGDLFDRWNSSAELINFTIKRLPKKVIAIPGQHDLPYHNLDLIHRSAYGTLVLAGRIQTLAPLEIYEDDHLQVVGFPWGTPLHSSYDLQLSSDKLRMALVHRFVYAQQEHPYAKKSNHWKASLKKLKGFDLSFFGDNHTPFQCSSDKYGHLVNCGTFFRRKIDEREVEAGFYLVNTKGDVSKIPFPRYEQWELPDQRRGASGSSALENSLRRLLTKSKKNPLDFSAALIKAAGKQTDEVGQLLLDFLDEALDGQEKEKR